MSRGAAVTQCAARHVTAFEVEIEVFWCDRIDRLPPGRTTEAWLHPDWTIRKFHKTGAVRIGGSCYNRAITLVDFRADAFEALEGR
jgi:hypothetical protein